jgi:Flp pilus assembly secretin CpaC
VRADEPDSDAPEGRRVLIYVKLIQFSRTKLKTFGIDVGIRPGAPDAKKGPPHPAADISIMDSDAKFLQDVKRWDEQQLVKTLAERTLLAPSGSEGKFVDGYQAPIPAPPSRKKSAGGFIFVGTTVDFRPVLEGDGKIKFDFRAAFVEEDGGAETTLNGVSVPGFKTQTIGGAYEVKPGQTVVFRGMMENRIESTRMNDRRGRYYMADNVNEIETVLLARVELADE